jgi:hypothetical protein
MSFWIASISAEAAFSYSKFYRGMWRLQLLQQLIFTYILKAQEVQPDKPKRKMGNGKSPA